MRYLFLHGFVSFIRGFIHSCIREILYVFINSCIYSFMYQHHSGFSDEHANIKKAHPSRLRQNRATAILQRPRAMPIAVRVLSTPSNWVVNGRALYTWNYTLVPAFIHGVIDLLNCRLADSLIQVIIRGIIHSSTHAIINLFVDSCIYPFMDIFGGRRSATD